MAVQSLQVCSSHIMSWLLSRGTFSRVGAEQGCPVLSRPFVFGFVMAVKSRPVRSSSGVSGQGCQIVLWLVEARPGCPVQATPVRSSSGMSGPVASVTVSCLKVRSVRSRYVPSWLSSPVESGLVTSCPILAVASVQTMSSRGQSGFVGAVKSRRIPFRLVCSGQGCHVSSRFVVFRPGRTCPG